MIRREEKADSDILVKSEKMKKKLGKNMVVTVWTLMIIAAVGCSKQIVPVKAAKETKPETEKEKSEKIRNFNYLFMEALKQKIFGDYKSAMKYFLQSERIKPDDAVEYQISGIFALGNQPKQAIKYGEMALQKDPGNIWYYYQLASEFQMFGETDSLLNIYRRIVRRFPENVKDKVTLGDLYLQNKQPEKAIKIYEEIAKEYGKTPELEKKVIQAYVDHEEYNKALTEISKALALFGEDRNLLLMKAGIYAQEGDNEKAGMIYDKLLKKYGDDADINLAVYKYYLKDKEYEKALNILDKIIENNGISQNQKLDIMFGVIYLDDPVVNVYNEKVGKLVRKTYENDKEDLRTQLLMVDYYSKTEEYEQAMAILRSMIKKYPMFKVGWQQILYIAETLEEPDTVIYYAKMGMNVFKDDPLFDVYLCSAYISKNDNQKVIRFAEDGITKVLQKGVAYKEKETGIDYKTIIIQLYGYLGEAYKNARQYDKSDEAYEKGLKIDPDNPYLLNNYSYYLSLRKEKLRKALQMSGKTVKKEPDNSTYLDTYGWILYQMGKIKDAGKYIKRALDNGGDSSPDILEHYGDILYKKGDRNGAMEYWKKALEKGGNKKELEKKIESLKSE